MSYVYMYVLPVHSTVSFDTLHSIVPFTVLSLSLLSATQDSDAISTSGGKDSGDVDMCKLFAKECIGTLSSFGDSLMDVICRDACDGHDIGRVSVVFIPPVCSRSSVCTECEMKTVL